MQYIGRIFIATQTYLHWKKNIFLKFLSLQLLLKIQYMFGTISEDGKNYKQTLLSLFWEL